MFHLSVQALSVYVIFFSVSELTAQKSTQKTSHAFLVIETSVQ